MNGFRTTILLAALTALVVWIGQMVGGPNGAVRWFGVKDAKLVAAIGTSGLRMALPGPRATDRGPRPFELQSCP